MSIAGAINMAEFKKRNDGFNDQMQRLELQLAEIRQEEEKSKATEAQMQAVRTALEQKLSFENGVDAALVTTILDHIVVKKGSTRERVELEIFLKFGDPQRVIFFAPENIRLLQPLFIMCATRRRLRSIRMLRASRSPSALRFRYMRSSSAVSGFGERAAAGDAQRCEHTAEHQPDCCGKHRLSPPQKAYVRPASPDSGLQIFRDMV